tara:strand:+ start:4156 stop:4920 length:765 start_codon:yes stop_codon:yes gene_type:complete
MLTDEKIETDEENQFKILLNGFEGPIDLLLELAKKQKVDLSEISILDLAEQYIKFIDNYNTIHLEIAADYLVMAAWLTYLKSRLLLPKEENIEEHSPEDLENALRYQLQRLEAMQKVSKILFSRPLIDRDVFYGGSEEGINIKYEITYKSSLYDLLKSYSNLLRKKETISNLTIGLSELYSVEQSIERLKSIFGSIKEWTNFINILPKFGFNRMINKSFVSSNFVAFLELTKNDLIEMKQNETFGNIFVKSKSK